MLQFQPYNLLAGLVFGMIGWGAYRYGKQLELIYPRVLGVALMVYPYFVSNRWLIWMVGVILLVLLWIKRHE